MAVKTMFGGVMMSEHPLKIDKGFHRYLFMNGNSRPAPRRENHFMYQMPFST